MHVSITKYIIQWYSKLCPPYAQYAEKNIIASNDFF